MTATIFLAAAEALAQDQQQTASEEGGQRSAGSHQHRGPEAGRSDGRGQDFPTAVGADATPSRPAFSKSPIGESSGTARIERYCPGKEPAGRWIPSYKGYSIRDQQSDLSECNVSPRLHPDAKPTWQLFEISG
jgi:hypothetical protein